MEAETTTPGRGSPESAAWFRQRLVELGIGQAGMARLLLKLGDDQKLDTIARGMRRMATGEARVSGEMRAMLNYLVSTRAERDQRAESLEKRLEAWQSGRLHSSCDGVDTTATTIAEIERQLHEARDLPLTLISGRAAEAS